MKKLDWKTSYSYRNALQRYEEEALHTHHGGGKDTEFQISRKPMKEDLKEDKNTMLEEEEYNTINRLITKARIPGRMT
jgi:hypothetical protein